MPIPYKAEFFDRDLNFQCFAVIDKPEIKMDYLTLDKTTIRLPLMDILRGWYCQITQGKNTVYQGTVAAVDQSRHFLTVQLSPMIALFDVQVYKDRTTYQKTNLEGWMAAILTEQFVNSGDNIQNLHNFSVTAITSTNSIALNLKDNIHDFWDDIAKKAIENAKIVITCAFQPQIKAVAAVITSHAGQNEVTIEADLPNVIDRRFNLRDDWGSVNKCVIINNSDETQRSTFYASDYAAPTNCRFEYITVPSGETFANAAKDKADELLKKSEFDNLIELQFREDDRMIPDISIGQPVRILRNGTVYHTVLTGYILGSGNKTLIFGGIRTDLTKILKLKGAI